ncbi:thioredoxin domain-containing protein [Planococcus antarcticus DSM 14505]|uniref:Thioredoxin domain-containing protein n=1 Tax=Planococcus antarcticus DSM 14505 TaxID=1185653 RepID=A0AA87IKH2_9BACL|nr:thioredoxin family protein [Planococcus antarcticus]EIM05827.1 thioredoxin domain-containing protein [Planococcus antarcticus DSM 14505]
MFEKLLSKAQFKETISQDQPVLIKFYADWCPDCKRMDMFIGEVLSEFQGISSYAIDKDQFEELANQQEVMGIPSLLVFQNDQKLGHLHSANAKTPEQTKEFLQQFFS